MGANRRPCGTHPPQSAFSSFSPVGSDHTLVLFSPGSDSAQGSDVSLMVPKGETLGRLDWERG